MKSNNSITEKKTVEAQNLVIEKVDYIEKELINKGYKPLDEREEIILSIIFSFYEALAIDNQEKLSVLAQGLLPE